MKALTVAVAVLGLWAADALRAAALQEPIVIVKREPVEYRKTALQLSCDRKGVEEWYRTCRARERSAKVQ